jgi:hypothetical protein
MSAKKHPNSRWVRGGPVPRYDDRTLTYIINKYRERPGWHRGARVSK